MKMIVAIIQDQDTDNLAFHLREDGFGFTKIGSTGGFLREGNSTMLIGVEEEQVDKVIGIVKETCKSRKRYIDIPVPGHIPMGEVQPLNPIEVVVGGATLFILKSEKLMPLL